MYRVRIHANPPDELGLILGDALHNARSALDHVACGLVLAGGGTVTGQIAFPAAGSKAGWAETVRRRLKGATSKAAAAVQALAVYPGGDDKLHSLHILDIEDKHKLLIPVGMSMRTFNLHTDFGDGFDGLKSVIGIIPQNPMFQISDGMEIFSVAEQARFPEEDSFNFSFTFALGLGGPAMVDGRPVPLLDAAAGWIDHAETVATSLLRI